MTGTNPGAGFGDNILSLALSLTYCETVGKLVTIPCPNSIYLVGLLKQLNKLLPKKKKKERKSL